MLKPDPMLFAENDLDETGEFGFGFISQSDLLTKSSLFTFRVGDVVTLPGLNDDTPVTGKVLGFGGSGLPGSVIYLETKPGLYWVKAAFVRSRV